MSDTDRNNNYELLQKQICTFDAKFIRIKTAYQDGIDALEEYKVYSESGREKPRAKLVELKSTMLVRMMGSL